eukprot:TRINITY_DN27206_c0_g1_i1.p1 TRINITY_DN27206_c0_g1~~TRINITY_DN27206_c0_g1_i1.p1  ORF type:complete len:312 (+),score=77.93 TRINITY_DN27206_c0_g1_i1:41-937(+)
MRRAASHAGSWYSGDGRELGREITSLLDKATVGGMEKVKAIISPHAGLTYSGRTAAHGFKSLGGNMAGVKRVFILGPSHREYFTDVRLSSFEVWEGPIADVEVDKGVNEELIRKGTEAGLSVKYLRKDTDIDEHSIELQMPFLTHMVTHAPGFKIIPIVVGMLDDEKAERYGRLLTPYFDDPETRFVISSDFCHWGSRFRYTYHYNQKEYPAIGDSIVAMDKQAMSLMEAQDRPGLTKYFAETENTICGRTPISIMLSSMASSSKKYNVNFLHYSQSNKCKSTHDSSVSYASAHITEA